MENIDGLPTKICDDCFSNLEKFINFRSLVIESQCELKRNLNMPEIKNEISYYSLANSAEELSNYEPGSPIYKYENDDSSDDIPLSKFIKSDYNGDLRKYSLPKDNINEKKENTKKIFKTRTVRQKTRTKIRKKYERQIEREIKITCYDCMKEFSSRGELTHHKLAEHRINKMCPICLLTFDAKEIFQHYKDAHPDELSNKGPKKCDMCEEEFSSILDVEKHKTKSHLPPHLTCNICGAVVLKVNFKKHYQRHSEGPVTCKYCGSILKNRDSLRSHLMNHEGFVHTCRICGYQTTGRQNHRNHMKTHNTDPDARKQMCTHCGKKVVSLRRHLLSHTGERPYVCKYCNKGFTSGYALKVHTRQHKGEKPYMCHLCGFGWHQKVSLVTHLKNKHNQTMEENSQILKAEITA